MPRSKNVTSRIMASVKSHDTVAELAIRRRLWANGIRYRLNSNLFGHPDLVFVSRRVVVFVDGDLWHGNSWRIRGFPDLESQFQNNRSWWTEKIRRNIERDCDVTRRLQGENWMVLRFWESAILSDPNSAVKDIMAALERNPGAQFYVDIPLTPSERRRLASVVPREMRASIQTAKENRR